MKNDTAAGDDRIYPVRKWLSLFFSDILQTDQILALTNFVEDGFQKNLKTAVTFVGCPTKPNNEKRFWNSKTDSN